MSREVVAQRPPADDALLEDFPAEALSPARVLARAHSTGNDAGYYSSSLGGRFDLPAPRGTLYAADDIAGALRERLGIVIRQGRVSSSDAHGTRVTKFTTRGGQFAAVSVPEAANFEVTSELTSMTPYVVPQAWASAIERAAFDGIRYSPRFTPGPPTAWAIFGKSGAGSCGTQVEILDGVSACAEAGLQVLPNPPKRTDITVLAPPKK